MGVFGEREHDHGRVGGLKAEGQGKHLLDRNTKKDAHSFEGREGRGDFNEACEERVGGGFFGTKIKGRILEEKEGVEGLDVLITYGFVGGVEVDGGFGIGLDGKSKMEGQDRVDHEGCVMEVVHFIVQLRELLG